MLIYYYLILEGLGMLSECLMPQLFFLAGFLCKNEMMLIILSLKQ